MATSSKPQIGDLLALCQGLRELGVVQVAYGEFQATFEPPMPTLNLTGGARIKALDARDDIGEEERKDIARQRRRAVEKELYAATEGEADDA